MTRAPRPARLAQPRLEAEALATRFPPARGARIEGRLLQTLPDVGAVVHARRALEEILVQAPAAPSDVILWDDAAPLAPFHTRLGGWPFRPAEQPWPARRRRPLTFIAQWYLGDSADLVPAGLPGEVLLCFAEHSPGEKYLPLDRQAFHFEWQRAGDVASRAGIAATASERVLPFQLRGVLCRLPEHPGAIEALCARTDIQRAYLLATTQASRIGGTTWYIQREGPRRGERLLVTLDSLHPRAGAPWPYPSRKEPLTRDEVSARSLCLGDVGCLYVFVGSGGALRWDCDCY